MVTDPRFDPQPESVEAPPAEKSGCSSCLTGCGIAALVAVALLVIGGVLIWYFFNDLMASGATALVEQAIDAAELPPAEKQEVMVEVNRLADAIRDGKLSAEQSALLMQRIVESPLLMSFAVSAIEKKYIDKSGLNDEEKAASRQTLNRFLRGVIDEKIPQQTVDSAIASIADKQPDGSWRFRDQVSDEDLRKFLATAKEAADKAEIPDAPESVDPSEELKKIIDETLNQ